MASLEGNKAPAFSLDGSDGKEHSLSDYNGKTVVIGPKGDVIKHWPSAKKAEEHPDEVLTFHKGQS